ncbi:hypothetical protein [Leptolyngbya sp. FACHB-321]|nr:hypothetical protein [Leptolyngbya sp. FACHB-321]
MTELFTRNAAIVARPTASAPPLVLHLGSKRSVPTTAVPLD